MRDITKRFGSVVANDRVWLDIYRGEILALLGENGSGKTTLMNMLSGIYFPDEGQILIDGEEVVIRSPRDAYRYGIGMIHQHFKLVDVFTAAENITLGLDEKLDLKATAARIRSICERYGFDLDPNQKIYDMSVSQKQTVEIVKALYRGADILILDEPTAVLTPQETDKLFAVLRSMRDDGKAVVIITHKLNEVMALSDRVAVLRKGSYIGTVNTKETSPQALTEMMVGEKVSLNIDRPEPENPREILKVSGLTCLDNEGVKSLDDVSFTAFGGEILGVAGIAGSGQKELLEAITNLCPIAEGTISCVNEHGKEVVISGKSPEHISKESIHIAHISFVPEDRLGMGLVASMDMTDNMMLRSYREGKGIFADRKKPRELAERLIDKLSIVTPGVSTPVGRLSGGNVQKVLVGREIAMHPDILLVAYPVRGLDINSSYQIYNLMNEQKKKGVAVICVIEDLDVLLEISDRILVLCGGRVTGIVDGRTATKDEIGLLMTKGQKEESHV